MNPEPLRDTYAERLRRKTLREGEIAIKWVFRLIRPVISFHYGRGPSEGSDAGVFS
jgi:hypothetical protein